MSSRYGRNKKRADRARLEELEAELASERGGSAMVRLDRDRAERGLRGLIRAIGDVAPFSALLDAREVGPFELRCGLGWAERGKGLDFRPFVPPGEEPDRYAMPKTVRVDLHQLFADLGEFGEGRLGKVVRVRLGSVAGLEIAYSREALEALGRSGRMQAELAELLAAKLARAFAKGLPV